MSLLIHDARILSLSSDGPRRGSGHGELDVIPSGHVLVEDGLIVKVDAGPAPADLRVKTRIDAAGRVLMPGFVDAHTHACWAGDRLDEWELKQAGASYLEILESGGGIHSTVRAVREASEAELAETLTRRLASMNRSGTTTAEVKSGYGLTTADELKMLRAIARAAAESPVTVMPTACIAHAIDASQVGGAEAFVKRTLEETLPAVHAEFPDACLDAYCEQGAWSLEQVAQLFEAAAALGHPLRVHSDQFNELGMTRWSIENGVRSVDHLEATSTEVLHALADSELFGVMLPCSGFHTDGRYGDARAFLDAGGKLVLATNFNPGSSPCGSMPMTIALATRHLGMSAAEAITAGTLNAAHLLGLQDRGQVKVGRRADLALLSHQDERQLGYEFGGNPVDLVVCGGQIA